jgi:hypothetical protein
MSMWFRDRVVVKITGKYICARNMTLKDEVLDCVKANDIETVTLIKNRLRWFGHIARMPDNREESHVIQLLFDCFQLYIYIVLNYI